MCFFCFLAKLITVSNKRKYTLLPSQVVKTEGVHIESRGAPLPEILIYFLLYPLFSGVATSDSVITLYNSIGKKLPLTYFLSVTTVCCCWDSIDMYGNIRNVLAMGSLC